MKRSMGMTLISDFLTGASLSCCSGSAARGWRNVGIEQRLFAFGQPS